MMPVLTVKNLSVSFPTKEGETCVVDRISFDVGKEKLGIVGESGSGKSMTARAIMGLLPPNGTFTADHMTFEGFDLLSFPDFALRRLRGRKMSMILQDPKFSLNPVMRVGDQVSEALRVHMTLSKGEARRMTLDLLAQVRIDNPERVYALYPHEVSGGMGQRIMIAMMLAAKPKLLVADEPTSALDVSVRTEITSLLDELIHEQNMSLIFISHDLNLVSRFCDRVAVMYQGKIVETIAAAKLHNSSHPYVQGLLHSQPKLNDDRQHLPTLDRESLSAQISGRAHG